MQQKWQRGVTNSVSVKNFHKGKILLSHDANNLTVEQARKSGAHMEVLEKWNKTELVATISLMISELLSTQLNDLSDSQVLNIAETIIFSCKAWTPDDILLVLRNGRDGKYKNDNARWTLQTFNRWADEYEAERSNVFYNYYLNIKETPTTREDNKEMLFNERKKQQTQDRKEEINLRKYIDDTLIPIFKNNNRDSKK